MIGLLLTYLGLPENLNLPALWHGWRDDALVFVQRDLPKLVLVAVGTLILIRVLRVATRELLVLQQKKLVSGIRAQQVRTLAGVITGVGIFAILFVAGLETLSILGLNLGPLLASAGIAGLAIGFGAQTLVHDVINGFFILLEDQYNLGDTIRIAGVKGVVEEISLRRTVLRDDDGTVHMVPNSQITIVSNMTRDWAQFPLRVSVAYSEPSDRIVTLLQRIANDLRHDPNFSEKIVSDIEVPGIDRVGNGEAEYLILVKTRPNQQYPVSRELRRRIKDTFQKENVQTPGPGRLFVAEPPPGGAASS